MVLAGGYYVVCEIMWQREQAAESLAEQTPTRRRKKRKSDDYGKWVLPVAIAGGATIVVVMLVVMVGLLLDWLINSGSGPAKKAIAPNEVKRSDTRNRTPPWAPVAKSSPPTVDGPAGAELKKLISGNSGEKEQAAKKLGEIKEPRAAGPLADCLPEGHFVAAAAMQALMAIGPTAESDVLRYVLHPKADIRGRAYQVLNKIGTPASLTRLRETIEFEPNPIYRNMAQDAIAAIESRGGK
jgi:hypothetical protein